MDYNAIAQALIDNVTKASQAGLASLDVSRDNNFATINQQQNASGTLYSSGTAFKKNNFVANTYLPKKTELEQQPLMTKLSVLSNAADVTRQIDAQNRAAAELNKIVYDY